MVNVDALMQAFTLVFTFETMMWLAIGVTIGVGVGAMPGLTATTGVALMLPLTFTMDTAAALGLLIGLYKGAVYGGSISAISFATPGTSEAAATVFDGYKMMRTGKGRIELAGLQVPVCIGDVVVRPGDLLRGDADGVVVVPKLRAAEVLDIAEDIWAKEDTIRQAIRRGVRLDEARASHHYHLLQSPDYDDGR